MQYFRQKLASFFSSIDSGICLGVLFAVVMVLQGGEMPATEFDPVRFGFEIDKMTPRQRQFYLTIDLGVWNTDEGLERLVTQMPSHPGNAADYYVELERLYPLEKEENSVYISPSAFEGVMKIITGSLLRDCILTPSPYPVMDRGDRPQPDILVYEAYLHALLRYAAALEKENRIQEAASSYRAGLIWGWHMTKDRSSLAAFMLGLSIKMKTAQSYASFLDRNLVRDKAALAQEYAEKIGAFRIKTYAKSRVQMGEFANLNSLYSCARAALEDQEPFWRQEAIMRLAVMRHGKLDSSKNTIIPDSEAERLALQVLREVIKSDPVPHIRQLAEWSIENVTYQSYVGLRSSSTIRRGEVDDQASEPTRRP